MNDIKKEYAASVEEVIMLIAREKIIGGDKTMFDLIKMVAQKQGDGINPETLETFVIERVYELKEELDKKKEGEKNNE